MSLISATHWVYSYGEGFSAVETRTFGNEKTARMWADEVLGTITTTSGCYWRDVGRGGHVDLTEVKPSRLSYGFTKGRCSKRDMRALGHVEPRVVIVPSVGELGWTP